MAVQSAVLFDQLKLLSSLISILPLRRLIWRPLVICQLTLRVACRYGGYRIAWTLPYLSDCQLFKQLELKSWQQVAPTLSFACCLQDRTLQPGHAHPYSPR